MIDVVITGMGAITPSGLDVASLWDAVAAGRSAITRLTGDEFAASPVRIGGRVRGFDPAGILRPPLARRLDPAVPWAIAAADEAFAQAGIPRPDVAASGSTASTPPPALPWDPSRAAVIAATGSGPVGAMQAATRTLDARGARAVPSSLSMYGAPDAAAGVLAQRYGVFGPSQAVSATCASGAIGLGQGLRMIRHGYADAVLVVGLEDCLNAVHLASNANMRALATGYDDDPTAASRPFDRGRRGFVMAQGAAAILLEAAPVARARSAVPLARLAGFGASSDAYHPTAPHPQGRGGAQAIRACLADAGLHAFDDGSSDHSTLDTSTVDHINAHGTGTPAGDAAELQALQAALGPAARSIPLSATKSSTGHLLGASGVVEAILSVQALRTGILPPTRNLDDPEFPDWNIVTTPTHARIHTVLATSFGFGGHNGAVLFTDT